MTEILKIILLLSVGQGLALALLLLFKSKGNLWANRMLSFFILLVIIPLWNEYISFLPTSFNSLILHSNLFYIQFLYGPLLFLYTVHLTKSSKLSMENYIFLAIGPVFGSIFMISHSYFSNNGFDSLTWYLFFMSVIIQIAICLSASWFRLKRHNRDIKQNLSNLEKAKLNWLKLLIICYAILLVIDSMLITSKVMHLPTLDSMRLVVSISECLFIFFIGFLGISKPEIHFEQVLIKANRKYDNSSLSHTSAKALIDRLMKLMNTEELYLENDISLVSLASSLNTTPHHLSQAINQLLNQNFYDFINSARIERAKAMLSSAKFKHLPIIDIAYQVGFNNKTSFTNAFKKYNQLTPTQYKSTHSN